MKFKRLTENLDLKIISLLLGVVVWFNAVTDDISVYSLSFKVEYSIQDLGDTLVIISDLPQSVNTSIKTSGKTFLRLRFSDRYIHKNIQNLRYGINEIKFSYEDIPVSLKDIEIFSINPQSFFINVDRKISKPLQVKPSTITIQDELLTLKKATISPETATVRGPASIVGNMQYLTLEPVKVKKSTDTLIEVKLEQIANSYIEIPAITRPFLVKMTFDSLKVDSIYLRTAVSREKIKVTYLKPYDLTPITSKMFKVTALPIDSTGEIKFYKISVSASPPIRVKSVEPEIITVQ
ncbi:MAG TPA: hypothetical protein PKU94_04900 [Candidatus Hydrothermia bacterium]|nr:hypothetical protein [Candidatus Hydrothermae bacterium]MDD3648733.1 hypothetical protein [Candidatus Hydrothermia bacterium]MDD5573464.1 hypothetical protein [Candidatus Hydrothermia bacterium]HOK22407.1 hypothetical protein [Candidatus Hydrothermia bacterium]HOL23114.1 hypothetical protein [Candidatus Hydrothermia bacterium]